MLQNRPKVKKRVRFLDHVEQGKFCRGCGRLEVKDKTSFFRCNLCGKEYCMVCSVLYDICFDCYVETCMDTVEI